MIYSVAELLTAGLRLPPPPETPEPVPPGTVCAVTGAPITAGYPRREMTTEATAEFLDHFRGQLHGWVSEPAARLYRSANPRAGNPASRSLIAFADGWARLPLIARESVTAGEPDGAFWQTLPRPCWSDLVREIWPARRGQTCCVILTTDTKKRLWPRARAGSLGGNTPVYVHDGAAGLSQVIMADWPALLECLALLEAAYGEGIAKPALRVNCCRVASDRVPAALSWERRIAPWRGRPEFPIALLIAQRPAAPLTERRTP